jgi:UDP-N-acetylmuramyl pentapeptide phosphotransferase/UDP-N-acetylglucosamine-1-phosphate transferase
VSGTGRILSRLAVAAGAAVAARALFTGTDRLPEPARRELERTNHRGETVTLASGSVLALAATAGAVAGAGSAKVGAAAAVAGLSAGAVGLYDDIVGARPDQHRDKGFKGHLGALREGRVSAGLVKVAGIGLAGLVAGRAVSRGPLDTVLAGGVIAGTANLINLLDLRPGRALKAGLLIGAPMVAGPAGGVVAGPVGAAAALLPEDLDERTMLGDAGANALGALLGLGIAASTGTRGRLAVLAGLVALTAASEKVSFTKVIAQTPVLRELDALGRRPAAMPVASPVASAAAPAPAAGAAPPAEAGSSAVAGSGPAARPADAPVR